MSSTGRRPGAGRLLPPAANTPLYTSFTVRSVPSRQRLAGIPPRRPLRCTPSGRKEAALEPVIPATELMPETTTSVAQRIAELQTAGATDRQILAELAKAAMAAAEDAAWRL